MNGRCKNNGVTQKDTEESGNCNCNYFSIFNYQSYFDNDFLKDYNKKGEIIL